MNQWLENISQFLERPAEKEDEINPSGFTTSTAAVPSPEEPTPLHLGKRRVKENYTSHWDLDYLPTAEADKAMGYTPLSNPAENKRAKK